MKPSPPGLAAIRLRHLGSWHDSLLCFVVSTTTTTNNYKHYYYYCYNST